MNTFYNNLRMKEIEIEKQSSEIGNLLNKNQSLQKENNLLKIKNESNKEKYSNIEKRNSELNTIVKTLENENEVLKKEANFIISEIIIETFSNGFIDPDTKIEKTKKAKKVKQIRVILNG